MKRKQIRGHAWRFFGLGYHRCATRFKFDPGFQLNYFSFRIVSPPTKRLENET
jgi:hypothetical protein